MANTPGIRFGLNHMAAPHLGLREFFALARSLDIADVEIRNDIAGNAILDGTPAERVRALAVEAGVHLLTINALQRFNDWTAERQRESAALADYAAACGAAALILVPVNDGSGRADGERQANLLAALKALRPVLADRGLIGFVEPLGFESCSLRSKREAAEAIDAIDGGEAFRLVHDTFHHALAGEPDVFPGRTGLVHISGVEEADLPPVDMRDAHRVLVGPADRLGNAEQIAALAAGGYAGAFSFEPFSEVVHASPDIRRDIARSMEFIAAKTQRKAA
jgi:2-keto-myo-inositol isomerase